MSKPELNLVKTAANNPGKDESTPANIPSTPAAEKTDKAGTGSPAVAPATPSSVKPCPICGVGNRCRCFD